LIAIHHKKRGFTTRWVEYCVEQGIPHKLVDCYANDLIQQLKGCDALMWHHSQQNPADILAARQILFAAQQCGLITFPDFNTGWHFDDKVGQKYLMEGINAPMVPSYVFYDKASALAWTEQTDFPKVFKLRGGAGSTNVKLTRTKAQAQRLVRKAFGSGFENFDRWGTFRERVRKFQWSKSGFVNLAKGIARFLYPPHYSKVMGKERGYVYFQDFIPNNTYDTRIIVIDGKAFGLRRYVRKNDFRASGSGNLAYERELFDERCIKLSFEISDKTGFQCAAYDFVFDKNDAPLIVEVSYGFFPSGYRNCPGYWDRDLSWHEGSFNPEDWMVDVVLRQIKQKNSADLTC
jgi:glutathione synthase/RimK-type ligase-like ATP-grasp enzyme